MGFKNLRANIYILQLPNSAHSPMITFQNCIRFANDWLSDRKYNQIIKKTNMERSEILHNTQQMIADINLKTLKVSGKISEDHRLIKEKAYDTLKKLEQNRDKLLNKFSYWQLSVQENKMELNELEKNLETNFQSFEEAYKSIW
jgi:chromosome segregation ATPase